MLFDFFMLLPSALFKSRLILVRLLFSGNSPTVFYLLVPVITLSEISETRNEMPAKPLTPEQKADAERLMAIFKRQAGLTQAVLADDLGFSTQSAVSQYLNGRVPLNVEVAIKFAERFNCLVSDFSPSIQREIDRISLYSANNEGKASQVFREPPAPPYITHDRIMTSKYAESPEERRAVVDFILHKEDAPSPKWADGDARAYADSLESKARRWLESGRGGGRTKKAGA